MKGKEVHTKIYIINHVHIVHHSLIYMVNMRQINWDENYYLLPNYEGGDVPEESSNHIYEI